MKLRDCIPLSIATTVAVLLGTACGSATDEGGSPSARYRAASARLSATYSPPTTYYGDGASYDGAGGLTAARATRPQCLGCHNGLVASDMSSYLKTGHKNVLRKVTPGQVWAGADGTLESLYFLADNPPTSAYSSASQFDWMNAMITVGNGPATVGTSVYPPGSKENILYQFGGWADPTQLDMVFRGGFTGEQWPGGNYDCARCHTTGYRFDDGGTEPSFAANVCSDGVSATQADCLAAGATWNVAGTKIDPTVFSRIPTDFACSDGVSASYATCVAAGGTAVTASWMLDGIQCERCHDAVGHALTGDPALVTKPVAEAATALCLQCHREENVDTINHAFTFGSCSDGATPDYASCVAIGGNTWVTDLIVYDGGACSDGVSPDYATCTAISGNTWSYAPFFDHESGPTFLNSPHARFNGFLSLQTQNATDMTLVLNGGYNSAFQASTGQNGGCTACHDPHQSLIPAVGAKPFVKGCTDCHAGYSTDVTRHPMSIGTPFDVGQGDQNATCAVCHMSQSYHLFRISVDPKYSTFPPASVIASGGGQGIPNIASDGKLPNAVWSDLDLACGQCHVGSGLLRSTPSVSATTKDKLTLAAAAICIHKQPIIYVSAGGNGTVSPGGTTYPASGADQTFTFNAAPGYEVKVVTVDGQRVASIVGGPSATYTFTGVTDCHTLNVLFTPRPTITATTDGNGSISPQGTAQVYSGDAPTFVATPGPNFKVLYLQIDGDNVHTITAGSNGGVAAPNNGVAYTFPPITQSHTIVAYFTPITFTITATAGPNGTIQPYTSNLFRAGSNQTFTFTPDAGYQVATVALDGVGQPVAGSYTFTNLQADHTIAVTFAPNPAAVITATASANGTITPSGTVNLLAGQSQSFTFAANAGYRIGAVAVDGAVVAALYGYTFTNIAAGPHTLTVNFVPDTFTVSATVASSGGGTITNSIDSTVVSSGTGTTTLPRGSSITYTITPAANYKIASVAINTVYQPISTTYTLSDLQANQAITVMFTQ